jgi:hypothetical protein
MGIDIFCLYIVRSYVPGIIYEHTNIRRPLCIQVHKRRALVETSRFPNVTSHLNARCGRKMTDMDLGHLIWMNDSRGER